MVISKNITQITRTRNKVCNRSSLEVLELVRQEIIQQVESWRLIDRGWPSLCLQILNLCLLRLSEVGRFVCFILQWVTGSHFAGCSAASPRKGTIDGSKRVKTIAHLLQTVRRNSKYIPRMQLRYIKYFPFPSFLFHLVYIVINFFVASLLYNLFAVITSRVKTGNAIYILENIVARG